MTSPPRINIKQVLFTYILRENKVSCANDRIEIANWQSSMP